MTKDGGWEEEDIPKQGDSTKGAKEKKGFVSVAYTKYELIGYI